MRHLLDSYIGAEESRVLANFNDLGMVELLAEQGKAALGKLPKGIRDNKEAMSETIENNLRKVIIEESPTNPMYYAKMSALLDELIKKLSGKSLNTFCKCYFDHGDADNIFGGSGQHLEIFGQTAESA